ncbi:PREDICTED: 28 kDa heat- and acid-stable phosphoprotein-like [Nicrophorus vespilloides]|uniref:28 kDa heat- and acid-stable phosphoprotein-like n=1 Tax=Nicrophorus vespilloides TaxID=110193 RepID=A0ABM1NCM5_NICVS|nr:PREDICTED: 28 kDa heat- and acid-stable phosphoprotein-like [Nicrophorus vespilloides]
MPKGKYINHKGRVRKFTNPEELEKERHNTQCHDEGRDETTSSDNNDTTSDEETAKAKGVSNLIEIENPNRQQRKTIKITDNTNELNVSTEISSRERDEAQKQKLKANYQKLHLEGKTEQAKADLARLAVIKKQREQAKQSRELEKKLKQDAAKLKSSQTKKILSKK